MGLPYLYAQPENQNDWQGWSFNHAANHYDVVSSVFIQKQTSLDQFVLNPVDPDDLGLWLYQHQVMHNQTNAVLGTSGYDLLELDWNDKDQFAEWLRLNADEHVRWGQILGLG